MIEVTGDVWEYKADYILIPVNGDVRANGEAVMGRGVALQAADRHPGLARRLGEQIGKLTLPGVGLIQDNLMAFPVKYHWREKADLDLIHRSARALTIAATVLSDKVFVLPRPGCGNGQLSWEDVRPVIDFLPDNVHVIDLP